LLDYVIAILLDFALCVVEEEFAMLYMHKLNAKFPVFLFIHA